MQNPINIKPISILILTNSNKNQQLNKNIIIKNYNKINKNLYKQIKQNIQIEHINLNFIFIIIILQFISKNLNISININNNVTINPSLKIPQKVLIFSSLNSLFPNFTIKKTVRLLNKAIPQQLCHDIISVHDTQYEKNYQLYITHKLNSHVQQNIEFIQSSPNLLILSQQPHNLIIQQQHNLTLKQYVTFRQQQTNQPYLQQSQARDILLDVIRSLSSYCKNNIDYNCICEDNIVRKNGKWMVSLAGILNDHQKLNRNYYDIDSKNKQIITYALAGLMFKLVFGFVPFQGSIKKPNQINFKNYIQYLQRSQKHKKMLKIYYFAQRVQNISIKLKSLITDCLSTNKLKTLEQLISNQYFYQFPLSHQINNNKSNISNINNDEKKHQIKMISHFDNKYHSIIMASIQYKKKNSYEKINIRTQNDIFNFIQLKQSYKIDPLLSFLHFAPISIENQIKTQTDNYNNLHIEYNYFYRQFQYNQGQRPTLQVIKLIEKDKLKSASLYQTDPQRQNKIKLYAYPYSIVFELANIYKQQSIQIKKKIQSLVPLLLNISNLYYPITQIQPLHPYNQNKIKFEDIKYKFRQLINSLYRHFLIEAMKKYNAKKENLTINEKIKLKQEGLQYYRLCLKLMQTSVIIRKKGKDLDLQRIQTSQRKQIENDLENILKTYFPNKVQIK